MTDLKSLGYVTVSTTDIDRWRKFAFEVLGFARGSGPDPDALYLRMDERAARIIVVPGDADRVLTVGWEVRDHAALEVVGGDARVEALRLADVFRAKVIDTTTSSFIFELTGAPDKIDRFVSLMRELGLVEVGRTGVVGMMRGAEAA